MKKLTYLYCQFSHLALIVKVFCCSCLFFCTILLAQVEQVSSEKIIKVGLLNSTTISDNQGSHLNYLNSFVFEYWQLWGFTHQQKVAFVYLAGEEVFPALEQGKIDVVGLTTITGIDPDNLYSIPYASFKQKIFKHRNGNEQAGTQLAVNSPRKTTLDFLADYVDLDYYADIDEMLANYQHYDALYSIRPWALEQQLAALNLAQDFYVSSDEAPEIHFHFATRKSDRPLMAIINDSLRAVTKSQLKMWQKKYIPHQLNNFSFTLGDYIPNLTEAEKQYVIDNNHLDYPVLPSGFPPYIINKSFIHINERGLTMDMLKHITKTTGLVFNNVYVDRIETAKAHLAKGEVDFYALANKGAASTNDLLYSTPYVTSHFSLIYRYEHFVDSSLNALNTQVIAVVRGLTITEYLQQQLPQAKFKYYHHIHDAIYAVAKGDANAYIGEALNNAYIIKQEKLANLTSAPFKNIALKAELAFATLANNEHLISLLDRAINSLSASEFDSMYATWSKTAFSEASAKKEVEAAYKNATMVIIAIILFVILLMRFYIRQLNFRKAAQHNIEKALAVAEEARAEAERSAQAKINFLARMSHEIRTPMNGVLGMAESLSFTELSANQKNLLRTLTGSAENLLMLLNDILDFAKMDAGKLTLESQPVSIQDLAERSMQAVRHVEKEKNITLNVNIDGDLNYRYFADPLRLTQVFNNLISNAIKFTEQGSVTLSANLIASNTEQGNTYDTIRLSVKDSGIGISPAQQKHLFSPFTQADSAVTRKFGGTGLGLSICQEIVNAMGSQIYIQSSENVGSDFYFELSLKQVPVINIAEERRQKPRDQSINTLQNDAKFEQLKVLMAEDNLVNVKVLSAQLARLNITADIAENGQQALTLYEQTPYDIVISDCHMPIVDGYELAALLKQKKHQQKPWLIAITADALEGTAEKCLAAGFDDYIAKPCTQATVTNKLHHALRKITAAQLNEDLTNKWSFVYFKPALLMAHNDYDRVLCKNIAQVFIDMWRADKPQLISALDELDFHHIFALVHRLKGSIRYLGSESIECNAILIQKQAHALQKEAIRYSCKLFIRELDLLTKEVIEWLGDL